VTVQGSDRTFATSSVQVFRIRDGKILLFRDYANPRALSEALGDDEEGAPA
jgi:ketosteroid isomerase-like protein